MLGLLPGNTFAVATAGATSALLALRSETRNPPATERISSANHQDKQNGICNCIRRRRDHVAICPDHRALLARGLNRGSTTSRFRSDLLDRAWDWIANLASGAQPIGKRTDQTKCQTPTRAATTSLPLFELAPTILHWSRRPFARVCLRRPLRETRSVIDQRRV